MCLALVRAIRASAGRAGVDFHGRRPASEVVIQVVNQYFRPQRPLVFPARYIRTINERYAGICSFLKKMAWLWDTPS